jgi:iron complex outermembrane receptor protein
LAGAATVHVASLAGTPLPTDPIIIRVVDPTRENRGIPQAQVTLTRVGHTARTELDTLVQQTGLDGRAHMTDLPPGRYHITIQAIGYDVLEDEIEVPAASEIVFRLSPTPFRLKGVLATANPLGSGVSYTASQTYDREELTGRMDPSIGSMLDGEPGLAMRSLGVATTRPVIRGFDGDRILVLENGERMGDVGESSADHAVGLDPLAIERIEVVRGPASLLYGSGALGGVVNLITRDIPRTWTRGWEGAVQTQGASMNDAGSGSAFLLYGADGWATTFRLSVREAGDIRTPTGTIQDTGLSSRDAALGWVHQGDAVRLGMTASLVDRAYDIPEAWDDPDEEVFISMERQALQGRLEWDPEQPGWIHGLEVRTLAARFFQQEIEREFGPDGRVEDGVGLEYDAKSLTSTATLRHGGRAGQGGGALGLSLRAREMDIGGDEAFTPGIRERSLALFTFQESPLSQTLTLQFGGRVEQNWHAARPNEAFPTAEQSRNAMALSGSLGLNWRTTAGWEAGLQLARAHRVPRVEELYANGAHLGAGAFEIGTPELADEVSHGADVFVRRNHGRASVELALFGNWIRDYIAFQPLGYTDAASGFPVFQHQGTDAQMFGGEVAGSLELSDVWSVRSGLDWVQGTRADETREPLPTIPPLRARLEVRADPGSWWWGGVVRAVSAQRRVAPDEAPTGGYYLVDTQFGFRMGPMGAHGLILRVDNALGTRYRDHLSRMPERDFFMPGRNVSVSYRWQF